MKSFAKSINLQSFQLSKSENPVREGIKTIGLTLSLAFGVRIAAAQCYLIPSGSMEPTLEVNDRLLVDKISYSFTSPHRGDVVVFNPPPAVVEKEASTEPFIKRVIGLPGEQIEVKGGRVYVNNQPLQENYIADEPNYNWGPQIVPRNSYLVLGDNRNKSYDGHIWGFLKRDRLIGKAVARFWPPERFSNFASK
ncbi:signal peptidase I [Synechocystis sp. PCC 7509]|uniref:signal peptidase I n=1 Tax=Synechocystis sp. PCC 7509 TaxID=927677 RepID=UPI0002ABB86B|nr:signal peptidase I [Synechocystis sp. PCC 7509]